MAQSWWKDVITQAFNPPVEPGEDIGTPFHTPVTALESGVVESVSYGGFGARIDIAEGKNTVIYYQHLDEIAPGLHAGSQITAGELLGLSGGQLAGGQNPNSPQNSSGPHIEVGELISGRPVNPAALIAAGPQVGIGSGGGPSTPGYGISPAQLQLPGGISYTSPGLELPDPIAVIEQPFRDLFGAITGTVQAGGWLQQNIIPLVVAALVVLIILGAGGNSGETQKQMVPIPVPV